MQTNGTLPPRQVLPDQACLRSAVAASVLALGLGPSAGHGALADRGHGFAPAASASITWDSNLLNRPETGPGPRPQSDMVTRLQAGADFDLLMGPHQVTGQVSAIQNRHDNFRERNTDGYIAQIKWAVPLSETLKSEVELGQLSDQAPIQTGQSTAVKRDRDNQGLALNWVFHPEYALGFLHQQSQTRFAGVNGTQDPALAGLNRDDTLNAISFAYQPSTGSQLGVAFKHSEGDFPIRQVIGPGVSVSNNFRQDETELFMRWNASDLSTVGAAVSNVERQHDEFAGRNYSGINYRLEWQYRPASQLQFNISTARQIIGISDVTNSDALARQFSLEAAWALSAATTLRLSHRPQRLEFSGTDGLGLTARNDRLTDNSLSLDWRVSPRLLLTALLRQRERESSLPNSDYSADSFSLFLKYAY